MSSSPSPVILGSKIVWLFGKQRLIPSNYVPNSKSQNIYHGIPQTSPRRAFFLGFKQKTGRGLRRSAGSIKKIRLWEPLEMGSDSFGPRKNQDERRRKSPQTKNTGVASWPRKKQNQPVLREMWNIPWVAEETLFLGWLPFSKQQNDENQQQKAEHPQKTMVASFQQRKQAEMWKIPSVAEVISIVLESLFESLTGIFVLISFAGMPTERRTSKWGKGEPPSGGSQSEPK